MDTSDNYDLFTDATSIPIDGAALSGLSTAQNEKKTPKPSRVKKTPKLDLSTAINPLVDDETKPVNYKKPTGKKSASSSSCVIYWGCSRH